MVVVCAVPLPGAARAVLAEAIGADVVDIREAPDSSAVDVVLVPSSSPQLVAAMRRQFPSARVLITELEDELLGIDLGGPVRRLLNAGADDYVVATSTADLAAALRARAGGAPVEAPPVEIAEKVAIERISRR